VFKNSKLLNNIIKVLLISILFETIAIYEYMERRNKKVPVIHKYNYKDLRLSQLDSFKKEITNISTITEGNFILDIPGHTIAKFMRTPLSVNEYIYENIPPEPGPNQKLLAKNKKKKRTKKAGHAPLIIAKAKFSKKKKVKNRIASKKKNERTFFYKHKVQRGENLWIIARKYNVDLKDLLKENNLTEKSLIRPGQILTIKTAKNFVYIVKKGDSLWEIGRNYNISYKALMRYNGLKSYILKPGTKLLIPKNPKTVNRRFALAMRKYFKFIWPTDSKLVTSPYGYRIHPIYKRKIFHCGIDIKLNKGDNVYASMAGRVVFAGWISGYGRVIILKHKKGFYTRYAHLNRILVSKNQRVPQGKVIGLGGKSGLATGPHLHFEIRKGNSTQNPLIYLLRKKKIIS